MKRILLSVTITFLFFTLVGCDFFSSLFSRSVTNADGSAPISEDILDTYAKDVEFKLFTYDPSTKLPDVYCEVTFSKIEFIPVINKISITFSISDEEYEHSQYFAILQDQALSQTRQLISLGSSPCFNNTVTFSVGDPSLEYRVVFGKIDGDNLNPHSSYVEGSAWIEWNDPDRSDRNYISLSQKEDRTIERTNDQTGSLISYFFRVSDTEKCIESFLVVLSDTFGNRVKTEVIDTSSLASGFSYEIANSFSGLAPNASYIVSLFASGNDGVESFENIWLDDLEVKSADLGPEGIISEATNYHQLFGAIYHITFTSTEAIVSYVYHNEYVIRDRSTKEPLELSLDIRSERDDTSHSYPLEQGDNELRIPITDCIDGSYFVITDQYKTSSFDRHYIPAEEPVLFCYKVDNQHYGIAFQRDFGNITDFQVKVYVKGYDLLVETVDVPDIYHDPTINLYHNPDDSMTLFFEMTVTYLHFGQQLTTVIYWSEP